LSQSHCPLQSAENGGLWRITEDINGEGAEVCVARAGETVIEKKEFL
jgi:hypothetical protein